MNTNKKNTEPIFTDSFVTQEVVAAARDCFFVSKSGYSRTNVPRSNHLGTFSATRQLLRKQPASLSPAGTARQHSRRVYDLLPQLIIAKNCGMGEYGRIIIDLEPVSKCRKNYQRNYLTANEEVPITLKQWTHKKMNMPCDKL